MVVQNTGRGIVYMVLATLIFAIQDGISRHLALNYSVFMVLMIRYLFLGLFVIALVSRMPGGIGAALHSKTPKVQILRGLLLIVEVAVMVLAFVHLGLVETHAVFTSYPLLVAALSGPVLGEKVGWRRWVAVAIGFVGVLVILQPGYGVFSPLALIPLAAAALFALYGLLTRYAGRYDSAAVSLFWTGIVGALASLPLGIATWQPMSAPDWAWMAVLCVTSTLGHFLLIRAYEVAEASAIQPFAYLQLMFIAILGLTVFGETLRPNVALGTVIVVGAGLFTLWRARLRERDAA